ncbi:MAG: hypothetical protein II616_06580, partial [Bacteroidales bacterium]|nr:hypothetical protein [Bacteroidales bacterium]
LTSEVTKNEKFEELVKKGYKDYSDLLQSLIKIIYNYEKEKNTRNRITYRYSFLYVIFDRPGAEEGYHHLTLDAE